MITETSIVKKDDSIKKFTTLDDYLDETDTAHIDTALIESISYDDEDTGNVSELTTYLHGTVNKVPQKLDTHITSALSHSKTISVA